MDDTTLPDSSHEDQEFAQFKQTYSAAEGPQLTVRSVLAGCLIGSVIACTNIYIGLKIGWTFGASIIAAVLSFAAFAAVDRRLSVLETNIAQTAGSAAGQMSSAAGLVAAIPALTLLGYELEWWELMLWALAVAFLGVFFAVPLRRQMVVVDKLKFPTGTATAETILAMYSEATEAMLKAKVLIWSACLAGLLTLGFHFIPALEQPPIHDWLGIGFLATAATWQFKLYLGPSLMGAGFLIGPRVVLSLMAGAIISWGVLGPVAQSNGWSPGEVMSYADGPRGWLLWPGVALMVSEALAGVALSWRTFIRALQGTASAATSENQPTADDGIPNSWWIGGLAAGSVLTVVIAQSVFEIAWYFTLIAILLSAILSIVAVRSMGETDINPVGGMGKVTQLVFGGLAPGQMSTNLMCAAITGAGASQAADMMQDLKTGHLLGASPRKQFVAQLIGICFGVPFVVLAYTMFTKAYTIGGEKLPGPAVMAWKAMAELLAKGTEALPEHATLAMVVAAAVGVSLALLRQVASIRAYVPSGLALGIAFIIQPYFSIVMLLGLMIWFAWKAIDPVSNRKLDFAVASGLIAGEGLMGIVNAGLTIAGVEPLIK